MKWIKFKRKTLREVKNYSKKEIAQMSLSWVNFNGFSGETCHQCGLKVNILAGGSGWICNRCDSFNNVSFHNHRKPHRRPNRGPRDSLIQKAYVYAKIIWIQGTFERAKKEWEREVWLKSLKVK